MANITAADVNKLRQITGAGMMDCKNALVEAEGDNEKAIDILRKKGQKVASKRADREANEGVVLAKTSNDNKSATVIMMNCETDFVAKNQDFVELANQLSELSIEKTPNSLEELMALSVSGLPIPEKLSEIIGKIGEKIEVSKYGCVKSEMVFAYNHPGNRLASIVGFNKQVSADLGKDIAMQIAAMSPVAIDKDDVNPEIIAKEREIAIDIARQEGKPEQMVEKIADGKVNKFYNDSTLLNQEFIKESKKTVRQYLLESNPELKVTSFKRLQLGN